MRGPQSVREIAASCGLPVFTISRRLGDVEKAGKAAFHSFDGNTPGSFDPAPRQGWWMETAVCSVFQTRRNGYVQLEG